MKLRIEVVDSNSQKADNLLRDLTSDIFDKYSVKDVNLKSMKNNIAEFLL